MFFQREPSQTYTPTFLASFHLAFIRIHVNLVATVVRVLLQAANEALHALDVGGVHLLEIIAGVRGG